MQRRALPYALLLLSILPRALPVLQGLCLVISQEFSSSQNPVLPPPTSSASQGWGEASEASGHYFEDSASSGGHLRVSATYLLHLAPYSPPVSVCSSPCRMKHGPGVICLVREGERNRSAGAESLRDRTAKGTELCGDWNCQHVQMARSTGQLLEAWLGTCTRTSYVSLRCTPFGSGNLSSSDMCSFPTSPSPLPHLSYPLLKPKLVPWP